MMQRRLFTFGHPSRRHRAVTTLTAKWLPVDRPHSDGDLIDTDWDEVSYSDVLRAPCRYDDQ